MLSDKTMPEGVNTLPITAVWKISLKAIEKKYKENALPPITHELLTCILEKTTII